MVEIATRVLRTFTTTRLAVVGSVSFLLLAASYAPLGVSISVSVHGVGDISRTLGAAWRLFTGTATLASLFLSYRSFRNENASNETEPTDRSDPNTVINVDGGDGNVTLNLAVGEGDVDSVRTEVGDSESRTRASDED